MFYPGTACPEATLVKWGKNVIRIDDLIYVNVFNLKVLNYIIFNIVRLLSEQQSIRERWSQHQKKCTEQLRYLILSKDKTTTRRLSYRNDGILLVFKQLDDYFSVNCGVALYKITIRNLINFFLA